MADERKEEETKEVPVKPLKVPQSWFEVKTNPLIVQHKDKNIEKFTGEGYKFFPVINSLVHVRVKAASDARIVLATEFQEAGPMYKIVLGASANIHSTIERIGGENKTVVTKTGKILDASKFNEYWISWDKGTIGVGRERESSHFMSLTDDKPLKILFIGVTTASGVEGSWEISDLETDTLNLEYNFFPVSSNIFNFQIKTKSSVRVALTTKPEVSNPMYEIMVSIGGGLQSFILKNKVRPGVMDVLSNKTISYDGFNGFWIQWGNDTISVGSEGESIPFMSWFDTDPFVIYYIGIGTELSPACWRFEAKPSVYRNVLSPGVEGLWVDASTTKVPYGAIVGGTDTSSGPAYIVRGNYDNAKIPGEFIPQKSYASILKKGSSHVEAKFQILVRSQFDNWVTTSVSNIPTGALPAGVTEDGEILYVGRVLYNGNLILGYVQKSKGVCVIEAEGKDLTFPRYEVLMI